MDDALDKLEKNRKQNLRAAHSAKEKSLPDTYGALVMANNAAKQSQKMVGFLRKGKDELYTHRLVVDCTERGTTDELNVPLGLHTYIYLDKIFIYSWTNPIWRHFILDNTATEFNSVVEGKFGEKFDAHYRLKLKREVEISFDKIKGVQQFFPIDDEDSEGLVYDAFLKELLKRRSGQEFRNIVFSIQKKQGEIIASPFKRNIIVQGCAGSGKSMIMLHRLPIILYDNGRFLSRSNVYIVSPSVTYIEMSDNMRAELEIEDLKIGTLNQYFDHVILKYGRDPKKHGIVVADAGIDKEVLQFVYSGRLIDAIENHIREILSIKAVDYTEAFQTLEMAKKAPVGKVPVQTIRQEIVIAQSILGENIDRYKQYSDAIRNVLLSLDRLKSFLSTRRDVVLRGIDLKISLEREQISKCEEELKGADESKLPSFIKGRKRLIRNARDRIIYYQEEKKLATEDYDYFSGLDIIAGQISNLNGLYQTGDVGHSQKANSSEENQYRQIRNAQKLCSLSKYLYSQVESLEDPYVEYAPLISESLRELRKALIALEKIQFPVLNPEYVKLIHERTAYLQKISGTIADDVYEAIIEDCGQKKNRMGKYDALACSPFIYLQILFLLEGPPNRAAESLLAIDEAQNLALEELQLLNAVNKGQTVFNLYGDVRQHVEGSKGIDKWEDFSQVVQFHTYTIDDNYRNASQITEYCNKCFGMNMRAINLAGSGVHIIPTEADIYLELGIMLKRPLKPGISCMIVQSPREAEEILRRQKDSGRKIHDLTGSPSAMYPNHWNMMTVSQAKGLEFQTVIVFSGRMTENEKYIAYTRALDELYIYDGDLLKGIKPAIVSNDKVMDDLSGRDADLPTTSTTRTKRKQRTKTVSAGGEQGSVSVKQFFENKGIEVVDDRSKSGFLWVIGSEEQIGDAVNEAVSIYGIYGMYGKGKVSKNQHGWFTKTKK